MESKKSIKLDSKEVPKVMHSFPQLSNHSWAKVATVLKPGTHNPNRIDVSTNSARMTTPLEKSTHDEDETVIKEMIDIFNVIRSLKDKFLSCSTMMDKVILVLTQLSKYV